MHNPQFLNTFHILCFFLSLLLKLATVGIRNREIEVEEKREQEEEEWKRIMELGNRNIGK